MEQRNEPKTAEIVKTLTHIIDQFSEAYLFGDLSVQATEALDPLVQARDRLEQLERENAELRESNGRFAQAVSELTTQAGAAITRAEKAEAERDAVVRCSNCKHLKIALEDSLVYAVCGKYGFTFRSFDADTRETGCTSGERSSGKENDGK